MKELRKEYHEPLFHITKRDVLPFWKAIFIRAIAILAALIVCSLLAFFMIGANPVEFISTLIKGSFGTPFNMWTLAKGAAILLGIALAITPAFRMRFWNIGAEGQVLIGALASVACVIWFGNRLPNAVLLPIMLVSALLAGAVWGGLPAIFKAKWGTNETLFTLMMNYVASLLVSICLAVWVKDGSGSLPEQATGHLPAVFNEFLLVILIILALTVFMYIYLNYTKQGYEIAVVGESENTARYVGIRTGKVIIRTMLISGAICGLCGFLIVGAFDHSIHAETTVGGRGFTAIMVSWLAKFNPIAMIATALLVVFLQQGGAQLSSYFRVSDAFPNMVVGIMLFFIIGCEFFIQYRLIFRRTNRSKRAKAVTQKGGADS